MYQNVPDMESGIRKININLDATNCVGYGQSKQPHYQLGDDMCYCIYTCNGMKLYKDCSSASANEFNNNMSTWQRASIQIWLAFNQKIKY